MEFNEKTISNLIENQFSEEYRENAGLFVGFVKKYYEWLESSNNTLYHTRRLQEYNDIDSTVDSFIVYFKEKYLNGIQLDTATNTKQFIKHSLDLYRSKGTERAIDLFFKLVYGKPAEVYYPGDDVFKLSSGNWIVPKYLEVTFVNNITSFIEKQIVGVNSGAIGFVEKYVRKKINGKYVELFYISSITGEFEKDERIRLNDGTMGPKILGSVNDLTVVSGGLDYSVGNIVDLYSLNGTNGKARVASTANVSGVVNFTLNDGGWGYSSNSQVLISDKVITIANTAIDANAFAGNGSFYQFETVVQPLASINYTKESGSSFSSGDYLVRYDSSGVIGSGVVVSVSNTSGNTGTLLVSIVDGNLSGDYFVSLEDNGDFLTEVGVALSAENEPINSMHGSNTSLYGVSVISDEASNYLTSEAIEQLITEFATTANVTSFSDVSAYANVIKNSANLNIVISNSSSLFVKNDVIQVFSNTMSVVGTGTVSSITYNGTTATARVVGANGQFIIGSAVGSANSSASGVLADVTSSIGVIDANNSFTANAYNVIYGLQSNTVGAVSRISTGALASFNIANTFLYDQEININTDLLKYYATVTMNSQWYGFPKLPTANASTPMIDALTFSNVNFGTIYSISTTNPGVNYDTAPMVVVFDELSFSKQKRDSIVSVSNTVGSFYVGETVTYGGSDIGVIKSISDQYVYIKRISFDDPLTTFTTEDDGELLTEDSLAIQGDDVLIGSTSLSRAAVDDVTTDYNTQFIGLNADVTADVIVSSGYVTALDVIDSGYGYLNGEVVSFTSANNSTEGTAKITLSKYGSAQGYYSENDGALSSNKKLHDGEYYQDFSYVIRSPISLNKYESMLRNVLHVAGTKYFAEFVYPETIDVSTTIDAVSIEIE